ncbi:Hyaluronan synthase 3 [Entomortierella lignicola]|nr:Hyaluronan synthase 3 [Entomortierella lignicola]
MPPNPPEETLVLSHQPIQNSDSQLAIHLKEPFTFTPTQNLGLKGNKNGASSLIDYATKAQQVQQEGDYFENHDKNTDIGHCPDHMFSNKNIECHTTSMMSPSGPQLRKGQHNSNNNYATLPSPDDDTPHQLPLPYPTPVGHLMPNYESNSVTQRGRGSNNGHGHHFEQQYLQQQFTPENVCEKGQQPYIPYPNLPSPHSSNHSPVIQHREYVSPQFSTMDTTNHYQAHDAFPDMNTSTTKDPPPCAPTAQNCGLKSSHVSLWKRASWVLFTMGIFLFPYCILKASLHLQIGAGAWQTSVSYSMLMAIDFLAVITFSTLNRRSVTRRVMKRDPHWVGLTTGILAVGYREDPDLLEGCLKSLRAMRYQRNQRIMLVVDGNEQQDEYMAEIFMKIFEKQGAAILRPDFLCMDREASNKEREEFVRQAAYHPGPICIMQPHHGKRSAMYTGFVIMLQQGIESVVVTDSDTYLDPAVCKELAFALAESSIIGAATGDVRIYNTGTWVSFLSSIRYWFAFNLERGAQSFHSVVNCVSGPLGIYRMSIVAEIMDDWVHQSFLGVLCTYGDDRHLTNLVLREGYKVKFSPYAICYTDTPIRYIAWVTQQTRWSKSFFREIPIQLGCMHLHSPWMTYALLYQLIYPMMTVYSFVHCIYFGTGAQLAWWLVTTAFVGIIKTAYAIKVTGDKKFFFATAYGFFYMIGYIPAKMYAALTLYDNSWGTSARLIRNFTQLQNYIAPVTWGTILFFGVINKPSRYFESTYVKEGQTPPFLSDTVIISTLACFVLIYLASYLWFFVRTGIITRDLKRDFSYEELFEHMTSYTVVDGGKRKVARFEV